MLLELLFRLLWISTCTSRSASDFHLRKAALRLSDSCFNLIQETTHSEAAKNSILAIKLEL